MVTVKTALAAFAARLEHMLGRFQSRLKEPDKPKEKIDALEEALGEDSMSMPELRDSLQKFVKEKYGEQAGAPIPVMNVPLVLEKRHPFVELNGCYIDDTNQIISPLLRPMYGPEEDKPARRINRWHSYESNCYISIWRHDKTGKITLEKDLHNQSPAHRFSLTHNTTEAIAAWTVQAEAVAVKKLRKLLTENQFKNYYLTGEFHEVSKRSGYSYIFRKLRPTVVLGKPEADRKQRLLCTMCLHPIGYYQESFAGCLCPTDDVIAHLLMMRSDEHRFWKKSVQHEIWEAECGI